MKQIINLLDYEEHKIPFRDYLKSLGAKIKEATNIYEAARFYLKGKTCVIYYKESKGSRRGWNYVVACHGIQLRHSGNRGPFQNGSQLHDAPHHVLQQSAGLSCRHHSGSL